MSTRQGLPPLSTSKNQLDAVYADAVWKRLDAETVWLNCPTLSKEGGRRLGADWSILKISGFLLARDVVGVCT